MSYDIYTGETRAPLQLVAYTQDKPIIITINNAYIIYYMAYAYIAYIQSIAEPACI